MTRPKGKPDINWTLRRVFGKAEFRPIQRDVILAALEGHDVFLQAATSFGKSLCFQLPAVVDHGITIVISPLLALMTNQVAALRAANVEARTMNSTTTSLQRKEILRDLECGHPVTRLLYVTPETCAFDYFRRHLHIVYKQRELARVAIDEAHCISEWGHDFRPSFQQLRFFKEEFPDVPVMCLTATATRRVRDDVIDTLGLSRATLKTFSMTTSRPNLHYKIRFTNDDDDHFDHFLPWLQAVLKRRRDDSTRRAELEARGQRLDAVSGIIYTLFRRDCESLAARLCSHGIGAKPYHAGLSPAEKEDHLRGWIADEIGYDIIVATTAFGMGIDKENVRFVVHWQVPKSFEGYYQEAGRAGRDQKAAMCMLYYSREDRDRGYTLIGRENNSAHSRKNPSETLARARSYQALIDYCEATSECRHQLIGRYFGEESDRDDQGAPRCLFACDWHKDAAGLRRAKLAGLADEEWVSTQRESGAFALDDGCE